MDDQTEQRITNLRQALFDAIAGSDPVRQAWSELEAEGYSLFLLLEDGVPEEGLEDPSQSDGGARPRVEPVFQINGADLSFLRSVGIDPTRKQRGSKG